MDSSTNEQIGALTSGLFFFFFVFFFFFADILNSGVSSTNKKQIYIALLALLLFYILGRNIHLSYAKSIAPDQIPHFMVSDLNLPYFPVSLLWDTRR